MPKRSDAVSVTIPPPILGINTKDPVSQMDALYAVEAENYFANGGAVAMRNGYRYYSKSVGAAAVPSVFELAVAGTRYLVSVDSGGTVYNSSASGAATDISGGASLNTGVCHGAVFMNRLFIKGVTSGTDVYVWTGTGNIALAAFVGPSADDKALMGPAVYKNRLYFVGRGSTSFWYGGVDAVTGALTEYNLQSFLSLGGLIYFVGSTQKQGFSDQQYFVAISDQGEVLLFQGSYPGDTSWSLIGKYYMPPPHGTRAFFYWGANLVIITYQGIVLLSDVLQGGSSLTTLSENINDQFIDVVAGSDYINGAVYPKGNMLIVNVEVTGGALVQYVYNTVNGSWWKFTGQTAYHWATFNNSLYFGGGSGRVFKADNGYFDENPASEGAILTRSTKLRCAFNYLGDPTLNKKFQAARPIIYESEGISLKLDVDVDYSNTTATSTITDTSDTAYKLYRPLMGLTGVGKACSVRIDGDVTTKRRSVQAIEVLYTDGDIV